MPVRVLAYFIKICFTSAPSVVRLSHRDYDACSQFIGELYAELSLAGLRGRVQPLLAKLIPSDYSSLNDFNSRLQRYSIQVYPERPELKALAPHFSETVHTHPFFDHVKTGLPGANKISDRLTFRQFSETAVYQEYYKRAGVRHQMFLFFSGDGETHTGLGLNRQHRDFSERDRSVLNMLAPHLGQAYRNARASEEAALNLCGIGEGFDSLHRAVILARPDGTIRWMSPLAREWMVEFFPVFHLEPRRLPAELKRRICGSAQPARAGSPNFSELRLPASGGGRLVIYCGGTRDGDCLLALTRERDSIAPEAARSFGLTRRETEILYWVSESKANPEIAAILGISPRTIHKHTEHLFAKLGVHNRLEAQRLGLELRKM